MESYIFIILFTALIAILIIGGGKKLRIKIKSSSGGYFIAEKKDKSRGKNFLDWFYYDCNGKAIEDEKLKMMLFEAFSEEDWYGDYEFYIKSDLVKKEIEEPAEKSV